MLPKLMAIINISPDSFSGDGHGAVASALAHAERALAEGADILDIGAESTRPGALAIDAATEIARLRPVLQALRGSAVPLSVDTSKAAVAALALAEGAAIINDVQGGADPAMLPLLAEAGCKVVLMHNTATPGNIRATGHGPAYSAAQQDEEAYPLRLADALHALALKAYQNGIKPENLWLDPGLGFGKSLRQNLQILRHLPALLAAIGVPLLVGASRKSFIGEVLDKPATERLYGTLATSVYAASVPGIAALRIHDVAAHHQALAMLRAIHRV